MSEEKIEQDKRNSVHWVMSTPIGRRFIWDTLSYCGVYHDIAGEASMVARGLGKREVGLYLLGITSDVDEELVFTMMREAKDRAIEQEIKDDNERRDATRDTDDPLARYADDTESGRHTASSDDGYASII